MEQQPIKPLFKSVLVIDDNEIDRYVAKRVILGQQFAEEIIEKESAQKAIEYLRSLENSLEKLPEFIFLDIRMPQVDGFGFLAEYEKLPAPVKSNCIIIMLSSSLDSTDHQRAESNPYVNRFLNKPLAKEKMELLEQEFLAKKHK